MFNLRCSILPFLAIAFLYDEAYGATVGSTLDNNPNKCWQNGQTIPMGSYYYDCINSEKVIKGCLSDGRQIQLGSTLDSGTFRKECVKGSDGFPNLVYKACLDNGRERQPGESWDDGKAVYTCKKETFYLQLEPTGCVGDGNRKFNLGEKVSIGEIAYECRVGGQSSTPALAPFGCVGKDGRQYNVLEKFDGGEFWYLCVDGSSGIKAQKSGCYNNGKRLQNGEGFVQGNLIYGCDVPADNPEGTKLVLAGCVATTSSGQRIERRFGCTWVEGERPLQVTYGCKPDDSGKSASKMAVRCNYIQGAQNATVDIGCYRIFDKTAVACVKSDGNPREANFVKLQLDDNGQVKSPPPGVRSC